MSTKVSVILTIYITDIDESEKEVPTNYSVNWFSYQ